MSDSSENSRNPFGSARFVGEEELHAAGLFEHTPLSNYCGEFNGRPLWFDGDGPVLVTAGPRAGKLTDIIAQNCCRGVGDGCSFVVLDIKAEIGAVARNQVLN